MGTLPIKYERRRPEGTLLYQLVADNVDTFFTSVESRRNGRMFPKYVRQEFDAYLKCGILEHGFLRFFCDGCEKTLAIGFSCKKRGFCPSCGAKRMCESAAYLVDHILPYTPYRQYVVSFPISMRYWLASRPRLTTKIVTIIIDSVTKFIKRRAKEMGYNDVQTGSVTYLQRFGGFLNLNMHAHILFLDGFYHQVTPESRPRFIAIETPSDEDVAGLLVNISKRVIRCLQRQGLLPNDTDLTDVCEPVKDNLHELFPPMAESIMASCTQKIAFGERAGLPVRMKGGAYGHGFGVKGEAVQRQGRRSAAVNGISLHCNVAVLPEKRDHLEKLLRYMARSSLSLSRLTMGEDGNVNYQLKKPFKGKTHVVLSPEELLEKLCALIPSPRMHMARFHGVFAPNAAWRKQIVDEGLGKLIDEQLGYTPPPKSPKRKLPLEQRMGWAMLLRRVYGIDMTICPHCQGTLRLRAKITDPAEAKKIIETMGLNIRPPPIKPSRVVRLILDDQPSPSYE